MVAAAAVSSAEQDLNRGGNNKCYCIDMLYSETKISKYQTALAHTRTCRGSTGEPASGTTQQTAAVAATAAGLLQAQAVTAGRRDGRRFSYDICVGSIYYNNY